MSNEDRDPGEFRGRRWWVTPVRILPKPLLRLYGSRATRKPIIRWLWDEGQAAVCAAERGSRVTSENIRRGARGRWDSGDAGPAAVRACEGGSKVSSKKICRTARVRWVTQAMRARLYGSRATRKPIIRCAWNEGQAAVRAAERRSKVSSKNIPPRSTRYAPLAGPLGSFRGDTL